MSDEEILEHRTKRPSLAGVIAVVAIALLAGALAVGLTRPSRSTTNPAAGTSPGPVQTSRMLVGKGPFILYATQSDPSRTSVFAIDLSNDARPPRVESVGSFPGRMSPEAGGQRQVPGTAVPLLCVESTADQSALSRLFLITRQGAERIMSTFDVVAGFAIDPALKNISVSRRSSSAVLRGAFLWRYGPEPLTPAMLIGPLHRPGGSGSRDSLRPIGFSGDRILQEPFCDSCSRVAKGLFVFDETSDRTVEFSIPSDLPVAASLSRDGSLVAFDAVRFVAGDDVHDLMVLDPGSGKTRLLEGTATGRFDGVAISPDGASVAYVNGVDGPVSIISVASGKKTTVPGTGRPVGWLPNGRLVVLRGGEPGGNSTLDVIEAGSRRVLVRQNGLVYLGWLA